jgi:pyruvate kinase
VRIVGFCTPRWHWIPAPDKNIQGQALRENDRAAIKAGFLQKIDESATSHQEFNYSNKVSPSQKKQLKMYTAATLAEIPI